MIFAYDLRFTFWQRSRDGMAHAQESSRAILCMYIFRSLKLKTLVDKWSLFSGLFDFMCFVFSGQEFVITFVVFELIT